MEIKTKEQYLSEAAAEMQELQDSAVERVPGLLDLLQAVESFDVSNAGAVAYAQHVENAVYFTATNTSGK